MTEIPTGGEQNGQPKPQETQKLTFRERLPRWLGRKRPAASLTESQSIQQPNLIQSTTIDEPQSSVQFLQEDTEIIHQESQLAQKLHKTSAILGQAGASFNSSPEVREASTTARETIGEAASEIATQIEEHLSTTSQGSDSAQAYTLAKIVISEMIGSSPKVQYLLQPPQEERDATGIEMVYITSGQSSYSRGVSFVDAGRGNPYEGYSLRAYHTVSGKDQATIVNDVARVYEDIDRNGVRRDTANFTLEIKTDKGRPSAELQSVKAALPFTGTLEPSLPQAIKEQTTRAAQEAEVKRIAIQQAQELQRKQLEATRDERARQIRQETISTTMGLITGTRQETAEQTTPSAIEAVAYRPTISLEHGTITLHVMRFTDGTQAVPVPVVITLPLGDADLTAENIFVERSGIGDRGRATQNIANMYSTYYSQLSDMNSIFGEILNSGGGIAMGTGSFADLRLAIGDTVVDFAQAPQAEQQRALAILGQTAQKMHDRYAASPLTRAIIELTAQPQRTVEANPETLQLRTNITQLLSGERTPEISGSQEAKATLKRATVSLNYNEMNLSFDAPRDANARPGDSRGLQITIPLGNRDFRPEDVLVTLTGYRTQAPLSEITDPAVLRTVNGYLESALQGGLQLPDAKDMADDMIVRAGRSEYGLAATYRANASTDMRNQVVSLLEQQQDHYQNSPLNAVLEVALEATNQPDPHYGPFGFMKPNVEQLAGYTNARGEVVPGTLLTSPDPELLATFGFWGKDAQEYAQIVRSNGQPTLEQTAKAVKEIERHLRSHVIDVSKSEDEAGEVDASVLWLPNPDGFSLQRGVQPVHRTHFDDMFSRTRGGGGTLRVEQADEEGDVPLRVDGQFVNIQIEPTRADERVDDVYEFVMENNQVKQDADGQPVKQKVAGKGFRPAFKLTITEQTPAGETETYSLYRAELGTQQNAEQAILIQCSSSDAPTVYTSTMVTKHIVSVTRKPVIYLYPQAPQDVTVKLDYKGKLTNTYPKIDRDQWQVYAHPDSTLSVGAKQYKYLFWDGINGQVDWDWSKGFSVHKNDVDTFLEQKIEALGLNFAEAQDFITYWAPMIKQNEWTLVSFQTERYEELAKLMIDPKPDVLIRVFMIFKKTEGRTEITEQQLSALERKGFTVVEWGGSNLDEINISA